MDINNYNYVNMDSETETIESYENDDMQTSLEKSHNYFNEIFYSVEAFSYDGTLDIFEEFESLETAKKLYDFIFENFTVTPPEPGEIEKFIETL